MECMGEPLFFLITEMIKVAINCSKKRNNSEEPNDQISKIVISDTCNGGDPCNHTCTITFAHEKPIEINLTRYDVHAFLRVIDHNKFVYGNETPHNLVDHFKNKDSDLQKWVNIDAKEVIKAIGRQDAINYFTNRAF